ncbi:MAG: DEAD/DEAH box helicase [Actinomycetota bacterium]
MNVAGVAEGPGATGRNDEPDLLGRTLTFIPADPPRHSFFAAWDPDNPGGLGHTTSVDVELVLPARRGTALTLVAAEALSMTEAVDRLAALSHRDGASASAHAWAPVIRSALSLVAEARVLPWVSADGWDSWRVDPVGPGDHEILAALAAQLPPTAHATPVGGAGRISEPLFAVRAVCDAVADTFLRTPAAHRVSPLRLFAATAPTKVPQLRPWVQDLAAAHCATARLVLKMVPPDDGESHDVGDPLDVADALGGLDPLASGAPLGGLDDAPRPWTVRFQLQSKVDPSLVVDAAKYWQAPVEVLDRFGAQAETVLLAGLRTVGRLVAPLADLLDDLAPTSATLPDEHIDTMLDAVEPLAEADIEVRWPTDLVAPRIERRLVVSAGSPTSGLAPLLQLDELLDVDWEFLLDGVALTAEELRVLSTAKRSVVSLRGRWVRLDRATLQRLRAAPPKLSSTTALAGALGAELDLSDLDPDLDGISGLDGRPALVGTDDGERVAIRPVGSFETLVSQVQALTGAREQTEPEALEAELRGYQRRGLAWMADLTTLGLGGCLADDMGLGKTIQVLALHAHRSARTEHRGPMLVVCPTSLMRNWQREADRFLPTTPVRVFHGANRDLDRLAADEIVVTSYGVVRSDSSALDAVTWSVVVADEAQQAKNPRSRTARALREITSGVRLALTGTPVENKLSELWSIFDWAVPGLLGPLETFRRTTALPIERDNDPKAAQHLRKLLAPFLLRRHKTDPGIAPELPPKIERDVVVPLTGEQATLYRAAVEESLVEVAQAEGIARRGLVLKLLTGLKQITNHPAQYLGETEPLPGRSGKLDALDELLAAAHSNGESVLVFTQYVAMGRLLERHLVDGGYRSAMLHGGLTVGARQGLVDELESGRLDALVLSLKAGGTGLNLTRATQVVHYDRWWNPAVEDQATDRAYRIGQNRTVTVHRIITQGTVEDRVATLLSAKRALAATVTGGGESWIGELDDDELAELVSLDPAPRPTTEDHR